MHIQDTLDREQQSYKYIPNYAAYLATIKILTRSGPCRIYTNSSSITSCRKKIGNGRLNTQGKWLKKDSSTSEPIVTKNLKKSNNKHTKTITICSSATKNSFNQVMSVHIRSATPWKNNTSRMHVSKENREWSSGRSSNGSAKWKKRICIEASLCTKLKKEKCWKVGTEKRKIEKKSSSGSMGNFRMK